MNIMNSIFSMFEEKNIAYIHFKSNMNLKNSFEGKADFDVLVDKKRIAEVETIILANKGKRFNPVKFGRYPGVDNWIIFDYETGILYHLHLHYQIASGKSLIKDYIIPWENKLFQTRVKNKDYDIFIADPNMELLLLIVRSVIKSHYIDCLHAYIGKYKLHDSLLEEKKNLISQINRSTLIEDIHFLFEKKYEGIILKCATELHISGKDFIELNKAVRGSLKQFRRMSALKANYLAITERFGDVLEKITARKFGKNVITKKVSLSGGAIIAFVGSDGAGKSTVTKEIQNWLSRKIECKRFYMGTGDGKTTALGSMIKSAKGKISVSGDENKSEIKNMSVVREPKQYLRKFFKVVLIGDVEKNNYKKIIKMNKYRINGGISVLDRYPQIEIPGQNDGPKISQYKSYLGESALLKRLEKKEARYMSVVKVIKPDVVFRLNVGVQTALKRKEDLIKDDPIAVAKFRNKVENVKRLNYQGAAIVEIDAEQPFADELLQIKRIIWEKVL